MIQQSPSSRFWSGMGLIMAQIQGIADGYNEHRSKEEPFYNAADHAFWNGVMDYADVIHTVYRDAKSCWEGTAKEAITRNIRHSHCSAFLKVVPDVDNPSVFVDLLTGHNTWADYRTMLRIFKSYHYPLNDFGVDHRVLFSSYPGFVMSNDDYYQVGGSGRSLIVWETTNDICNASLYDILVPQTLMSWQRTALANLIGTDGQSWVAAFSQFNSGTYNNQFVIINANEFSVGSALPPSNFVWVVEQMPGTMVSGDITDAFNRSGYFASYNRPYFQSVFKALGYAAAEAKFGDIWSHDRCPRANIFRREQAHTSDITGLRSLLRFNEWQTDPLSLNSPYFTIAARGDLAAPGPTPWVNRDIVGAIDAKASDFASIQQFAIHAVSSPPWEEQGVFSWTPDWSNYSHHGMPIRWPFQYEVIEFTP